MSQLRVPAVVLVSLALLSPLDARADDAPRPGDWTVVDDPAGPEGWQPGLWLPMRQDGERVLVGDALGRHAALRETPARAAS